MALQPKTLKILQTIGMVVFSVGMITMFALQASIVGFGLGLGIAALGLWLWFYDWSTK